MLMETLAAGSAMDRLRFDNPWWALSDERPQKFKQPTKRAFFPVFLNSLKKAKAGRALVLAGPRRSGKTVMVRQMVAFLLERGLPPRHVMFTSLGVPTYWAGGLTAILDHFLTLAPNATEENPIYAFLDELHYLPDWQDNLQKAAKDYPQIRLVGVLAAQSPAPEDYADPTVDVGFDFTVLPPLTFAEFLRFRGHEQKFFGVDAHRHQVAFDNRNIAALNQEFTHYINYGGFPESILGKKEGAPSPLFVRDTQIERILHKDMAAFYGIHDLKGLITLFSLLAHNTAREVSIEDLSRETKIAKNTLRKYLDYLEGAWLIRRLHRIDKNAKRFQRAVAFKVYLTHPSWYAALFGPVTPKHAAYDRLVETAVFSQWLGAPDTIGALTYASWRGGKVDIVGFKDLASQQGRAPEPDLIIEMDWHQVHEDFSEGPQVMTDFVRTNCNGEENTLILTRDRVHTGYRRHVKLQHLPASLYAYGVVNEFAPPFKEG